MESGGDSDVEEVAPPPDSAGGGGGGAAAAAAADADARSIQFEISGEGSFLPHRTLPPFLTC